MAIVRPFKMRLLKYKNTNSPLPTKTALKNNKNVNNWTVTALVIEIL